MNVSAPVCAETARAAKRRSVLCCCAVRRTPSSLKAPLGCCPTRSFPPPPLTAIQSRPWATHSSAPPACEQRLDEASLKGLVGELCRPDSALSCQPFSLLRARHHAQQAQLGAAFKAERVFTRRAAALEKGKTKQDGTPWQAWTERSGPPRRIPAPSQRGIQAAAAAPAAGK